MARTPANLTLIVTSLELAGKAAISYQPLVDAPAIHAGISASSPPRSRQNISSLILVGIWRGLGAASRSVFSSGIGLRHCAVYETNKRTSASRHEKTY